VKSLAERLRDGQCVHCDAGWIYFDGEDGEEIAERCRCRRAVDDVDAHYTSLKRMD
jgi:hypothetical protein